ncbi:MAG: M20/M25/M40 family metallo-hydrolase [Bacteroidales bacterium]|jgi:leucyl aminopeptidase|nr:M20/M25/M40 family metallo-hydrolase [Bacteroidales bacterium]
MKKIVLFLSFTLFIFSVCNAQTSDFDLYKALDCINKDSLMRTVQDLENFETRLCTRTIGQNKQVAEYIMNRLKKYGIADARIDSFYVSGYTWSGYYAQNMYNVLGSLKGSGNTDSTVIIGAHLDAISFIGDYPDWILTPDASPGADDNATGCAIMIEMVRVIHENHLTPYHNIDFMAYDAEEVGLMGSKYDAKKRRNANENIIVMLNNDMVAYQPSHLPWQVNLFKYANAPEVAEKARQACLDYTSVTPFVISINNEASDSYPYFQENYQAIFTQEHYAPQNTHFHHPDDISENYNFDYCQQIAIMNFVVLADYAIMDSASFVSILSNKKIENYIDLYPIPANNFISVQSYNNIKIDRITILDFSGRMIESLSNNMQQNIIRLDNYKSGIYFMVFYTDKGMISKKIIKL